MKSSRLLLSALSLLLALFVYFVPNERFPNSADDWSYLLQARLFASGHAYAQDALYDRAHPLHQYLGTNCVTDYQGRRCCSRRAARPGRNGSWRRSSERCSSSSSWWTSSGASAASG
jgi:hypothetical protein